MSGDIYDEMLTGCSKEAVDIVRAFGLPTAKCRKIAFELDVHGIATVTATYHGRIEQGVKFSDVVRSFGLVKLKHVRDHYFNEASMLRSGVGRIV